MTTPNAKLAGLALIAALCVGFPLGLTAPAWAGFDEGLAALKRDDYATALREFRPLAEQGNAKAQNSLGDMYFATVGVPYDLAEAVKWYRKAAEQGHAEAQNSLGFMYKYGQGVPQDYAKAVKWYRKAAEQGQVQAQLTLANWSYRCGGEVPDPFCRFTSPVDAVYTEAAKWYRLAAEQGNAVSQRSLGIMYTEGQGVPQDYVMAHKWLNLAAAQGGTTRDTAVKVRDAVAAKMTPAQISEAQRLARE